MQRAGSVLPAASLLFLTAQLLSGCGADCSVNTVYLRAAVGVTKSLTSPNYPGDYRLVEACKWRVTVPEHHVVYLYVEDMDIYEGINGGCSDGGLSIYDAGNTSPLAKLCGSDHNSSEFYSTKRSMNIIFSIDSYVKRRGFNVTYSARNVSDVPSSSLTTKSPTETEFVQSVAARKDASRLLEWPGKFDLQRDSIRWNILGYTGYVVQLSVVDMVLQNSGSCDNFKIMVYDTDGSTPLGKLCNDDQIGQSFTSVGPQMYVQLSSYTGDPANYTQRRFNISYRAVRPAGYTTPASDCPPLSSWLWLVLMAVSLIFV